MQVFIDSNILVYAWDASIVAAALRAQAKELWTEDLNAGQRFEGMIVRNPLATDEPSGQENTD